MLEFRAEPTLKVGFLQRPDGVVPYQRTCHSIGDDQPRLQPVTRGQLGWFMEGMRHARLATVFGLLSIFSLGILFGPLAIAQAKKAQAFGVPASEGKVLGWVGIGLFILWVVFALIYVALIITLIGNLPDSARTAA